MTISKDARLWIYQSDRFLTEEESTTIQHQLDAFTAQWQAHGHPLTAMGEVKHNLFIILSVDEHHVSATGCSIDQSVQLIKGFERQFNLSFFDRFQIAYQDANGIKCCSQQDFAALLERGLLNLEQTTVFNNLITSRRDLETKWNVPFEQSWHANFFNRFLV